MHGHLAQLVLFVLTLLFIASVVSIVATRFRLPLSVLLVLVGLALGALAHATRFHFLLSYRLSPEVVLFIFLPALIFESAFNMDARRLVRDLGPVLSLAIPALLISIVVVGSVVHVVSHIPTAIALLFGALISATDPVAVLAMFKELGAPKRLAVLVEGESLFNDGTALVVFAIILGIVEQGGFGPADVLGGVVRFLVVCLGGAVVGTALAFFFAHLLQWVENEPMVEITLTAILAHLTFLVADHYLRVSGVIATVMAGLVMGSYGKTSISPRVHQFMEQFWSYAAFLSNAMIFLLVGLSINLSHIIDQSGYILVAVAAVTAARGIAIYGLIPMVNRMSRSHDIDRKYQTVIFWGDLRGAVGLVMALSVQEAEFIPLQYRELILDLTLGIVLFALVVKGFSLRRLIEWLGLDRLTLNDVYEREQALLLAEETVEEHLTRLRREGDLSQHLFRLLIRRYQSWRARLRQEMDRLRDAVEGRGNHHERRITIGHCLSLELRFYWEMFERAELTEAAMRRLHHWIEDQFDWLRLGADPGQRPDLTLPPSDPPAYTRLWSSTWNASHCRHLLTCTYEMLRARVLAAESVIHELDEMVAADIVSGDTAEEMKQYYRQVIATTQQRLDDMRRDRPIFVEEMEAVMAARFCLETEEEVFEDLHAKGLISDKVFTALDREVQARLTKLKQGPIGEILVQSGKIDLAQLQDALEKQKGTESHIGEMLVELGYVTHEDVLAVLDVQQAMKEDDAGE